MNLTNNLESSVKITKTQRIPAGETVDVSDLVDGPWWPNIITLAQMGVLTITEPPPKPKRATKRKKKATPKE